MLSEKLQDVLDIQISPLDLLPQQDLREKILELALKGVPGNAPDVAKVHLQELRRELLAANVENVKVVVFGGGTGLSNIIGGDSRLTSWAQKPFIGLKEIFPQTRAVVCITDNGGSTGELLKDLPIVAIGDMRHVLLSSIQLRNLQSLYSLNESEAAQVASILSDVFNWRYTGSLNRNRADYQDIEAKLGNLPKGFENYLQSLVQHLFSDKRLANVLTRGHCFGNLLLAAVIYREIDQGITNEELVFNQAALHQAIYQGMNEIARTIGATEHAVLPCTSTPAQLRVLYTNGVEIAGEHKISEAQRGFPVESVQVDFSDAIRVYDEVIDDIANADIIVLAPGSLYSSIIPIFKVPGLADAVRSNQKALKILISNLWVQAGETDLSLVDPDRKFRVSDMIRAYEKNIPGGTSGLFSEVLCISLKDIPGSVLQRYAVEGKIPIYLDRNQLSELNYFPVECGVYSKDALAERGVIQHDPDSLALAIRALYNGRGCFSENEKKTEPRIEPLLNISPSYETHHLQPFQRYIGIMKRLQKLKLTFVGQRLTEAADLKAAIIDILLDHPIIPLAHLDYFVGLHCIAREHWNRDQQWDNVFSFYDPEDRCIKIRGDQVHNRKNLEIALMIALGESLLGDYASAKIMKSVDIDGLHLGRVYHLTLKPENERNCYFLPEQLYSFLSLARMCSTDNRNHYTRLVNNNEGFTPPGLLMGLMYAWYVDNRLASHIEYKMSVMKISQTNLIPEQLKMAERRRLLIEFFKNIVFKRAS